jgi:hypothetical protein
MLPLAGKMVANVQMANEWNPVDETLKHRMEYSVVHIILTDQSFSKCYKA